MLLGMYIGGDVRLIGRCALLRERIDGYMANFNNKELPEGWQWNFFKKEDFQLF